MRLGARVLTLTIAALAAVSSLAQQPQAPQPPAGGGRGGFGGGAGVRGQFPLPPRDVPPTPTGTARIRGRVTAADSGAPLRRAQVRLTSQDARTAKSATTDTEGRFELADLPAGRYTLTVSKAGYLTLQYGQRRPLERGRPIDLADAQVLERTDVLLPRGGAMTGRIVDEYGEPLADATVQALRYQYVGGQRQLVPAGRSAQTDDIGQYRIFGLPPGDYFVSAATRTPMAAIQAAAAAVVGAPPGVGVPFEAGPGLQVVREAIGGSDDELTGYAPTYYPGTPTLTDAQRVTIGVGEEMPGISFAMMVAKLAKISGAVVDSQGQALARGMVMVRPTRGGPMLIRGGGNTGAINGGAFTIRGVPPGDYVLQVRPGGPGFGGPGPGGPAGRGDFEFANVPISVNGSDIEGIVIATKKGATVTGHVVLAGGRAATNVSTTQVVVVPTEPDRMPVGPGGFNARVTADGAFELRGLSGPSMFRIVNPPAEWTLKAVRLDGADITDTPHEFNGGETVSGLEIELTDRPTRINGTVTGSQNDLIRDYAVVVFADDRDRWVPQSRFVSAGRPAQDGHFQITGLPPGRYLAVALEYLEQGSEMDPDLLEQLKSKATDFTLREGETHQLDLKLSF
jgi:hypothetical protein